MSGIADDSGAIFHNDRRMSDSAGKENGAVVIF
jgi:hypothetical protein